MKANGYKWWKDRIDYAFELFDTVRIDHFRGFDRFYAIESGEKTAKYGKWMDGPSAELFKDIKGYDIVAEDLGVIDDGVIQMMKKVGYPGMKVVEFAFDGNPKNTHLPHNYVSNSVAYTGTHDNNTLLGFIWELDDATRREVLAYCGYTAENWDTPDAYRAVMRTLFASVADLAILPIQDVLGFGADTRMNIPGEPSGNWRYRVTSAQLSAIDKAYFRKLNRLYGR